MNKKAWISVAAVLAGLACMAAQIIGYLDMSVLPSAPGNPASGFLRLWNDSGSTNVHCKTSSGASCFFDSSGGVTVGGVNAQTSSYTAVLGDGTKLVTFNCSGACTLTLPASPPSSTWWILTESTGAGALTISPNSLNIDGSASSLTANQNQGTVIYTDGTNYFTERGMGTGGVTLQTNGTNNSSQTTLNFSDTASCTWSNPSGGVEKVTCSGGGGGGGFGPWISPTSPPAISSFTWVNQGSGGTACSATNPSGSIITFTQPAQGSLSACLLVVSAPSTPYFIDAYMMTSFPTHNQQSAGLVFRNSTSGKFTIFYTLGASTPPTGGGGSAGSGSLGVDYFTSPTVDNSTLFRPGAFIGGLIFSAFLRIQDDGTNRIYSYSADGVNFSQFYSETRTTNFTADQVGFYCLDVTGSFPCVTDLISWHQH